MKSRAVRRLTRRGASTGIQTWLVAPVTALLLAGCGAEPGTPSRPGETIVWPVGGTEEPLPLSSSFGPRLKLSDDARYDFHRGIDIPAPEGTPLYAITAGEVKRAGDDPGFSDKVVQIEHCPDDGDCYYSTYLHVGAALVNAGDHVEPGQQVALSGIAESGFPTLHFEIRAGTYLQDHCVHPLHYLPSPSDPPPEIALGKIDDTDPAKVSVEVRVSQPRTTPDLLEVSIATSDRATGAAIEERVFNIDDWNRKYSPKDNPTLADDPDLEDLHIEPAKFNLEAPTYDFRFVFNKLQPAGSPGDLVVTARARGVDTGEAEVSSAAP
jgi:murein DD-endopeptidase MepM/ murein hydrolase activator NlpD